MLCLVVLLLFHFITSFNAKGWHYTDWQKVKATLNAKETFSGKKKWVIGASAKTSFCAVDIGQFFEN
jgi:hypothetical protein